MSISYLDQSAQTGDTSHCYGRHFSVVDAAVVFTDDNQYIKGPYCWLWKYYSVMSEYSNTINDLFQY